MKRNCIICGKEFEKKVNCSLKDWQEKRKTCSLKCGNLSKKGNVAWNKGKTEATDERVASYTKKLRNGFETGRIVNKPPSGKNHFLFGKKHKPETLQKMSIASSKERHWNWQGGITDEIHRLRNKIKYKQWCESVREKGGGVCYRCGLFKSKSGRALHCHHIKGFRKYPELRYEVSNGMLLCDSCHQKEHNANN